jgi:hypothetical protein
MGGYPFFHQSVGPILAEPLKGLGAFEIATTTNFALYVRQPTPRTAADMA